MKIKSELFDVAFYENYLKEKKFMSDSTIHRYSVFLIEFLSHNPDIDNIEDYNKFLIEKGVKKRMQASYAVIKNYIEFKFSNNSKLKNELIEKLVKPIIRNDIVRHRIRLSDEQILNVINSMQKKKHRVIALIQTLTGIRVGDALRIKYDMISEDVYEGNRVLKIAVLGKRNKRNVVYIHDDIAIGIINNWLNDIIKDGRAYMLPDYPFLSIKQLPEKNKYNSLASITYNNYNSYRLDLKSALTLNGIDKDKFSTHDYRRCFARKAWEKWKDIEILKNLLNHSQIKDTIRYIRQEGLHNIDYLREMQKM